MATESVFLVSCELSGESSPLRAQGLAGGFVTCIVPTDQISEAITEAKRMLTEDGYVILDIDRAARFDPNEWAEDGPIGDLVNKVSSDMQSQYSDFEVWGH